MCLIVLSQPWVPFQVFFIPGLFTFTSRSSPIWMSHFPQRAQSGLYELITFPFHSPGKCLNVRTRQLRPERCLCSNLSRLLESNLKCIKKSANPLYMRQTKHLCFVKSALHKCVHVTQYAEAEAQINTRLLQQVLWKHHPRCALSYRNSCSPLKYAPSVRS